VKRLHLDFETRSTVDLRKTGVRPYVEHPDTGVWLACYAIDKGPVRTWWPGRGPLPDDLARAIHDPDVTLVGHNVGFEWEVITHICVPRYGWPYIPPERLDDTAARAAIQSLPRSLDGATMAAKLPYRKDKKGHSLMLRMAKPRRIEPDGTIVWWDDPERLKRLEEYCKTDVEAERALDDWLFPMSKRERRVWLLDFEINHLRGVKVDLDLAHKAREVLDLAIRRYNRELAEITQGQIKSVTNVGAIKRWLEKQGLEVGDSLDKAAVSELLAQTGLSAPVCRVLEIRQEAGKSSTAKIESFIGRTASDSRTYETLLYHGAGTGRWAGAGIQLHNLPRPSMSKRSVAMAIEILKSTRPVREKVDRLEFTFGSVPQVISDCLRGFLIADNGHRFLVSDFSNIEGRGNAWNAGQTDKLELFAANGPIYERMGAAIYRIPIEEVTKDSIARFAGKQAELGCGYGMGAPKFRATCAGYGQDLDEETCQTAVDTFRQVNDRIVLSWYGMEEAAFAAMENPGTAIKATVGKVSFLCTEDRSFLICTLPSTRRIYYPWPKIQDVTTPWGDIKPSITYMGINAYTKKWERIKTYGGKICENVVQAIARDVLVVSMFRLEKHGYRVVLTVHDEIVAEVPDGFGSMAEFDRLMSENPRWAPGFPIAVEGFEAMRYRK